MVAGIALLAGGGGGEGRKTSSKGTRGSLRLVSRRSLTPTKQLLYGVQPMKNIVVITTVGTEDQANLLARELVARRQAACVNILPGVRSVYRWQGKICQDGEWLLVIKTATQEFESVSATIRELHDYELPEILAFNVAHGDPRFLEWIGSSLDKEAEFDDADDDDESTYVDLGELTDGVF
jgi:periplasmic divalent cation tolerance protein